jgi:hypothetical protein
MSEILDIYANAPTANHMMKSYGDKLNIKSKAPKSAIIDPYGVAGIDGVRQKPSIIPYSTLRSMAKVPAIAAVINTRLNQVARFARRPRFEGDMGFKIALKDKDAKMTEAAKKQAFEIEEFLLRTGAIPNAKRKDNFDSFLRKIVRDTLTLDAMTWENVPSLKGGLAELWAIDAATIEIVANNPLGDQNTLPVYEPVTKRGMQDKGNIAYVQKVAGQTVAEYTEDELCYAIRNPSTDIYSVDFGMSELETLIEIVTGIVNGVRYNTSYFSESHLPQGVLEIVGKYNQQDMDSFKKSWKTMTTGASGKWAVPVFAMEIGQGFKFTPFKNSNRDMEFNEFLEFLFNIACAVYQIDPNEVGFKSWTSSNSMSTSDNTEAKMDQSKDKGFVPLMQFLANTFNFEVVDRIDDSFALTWVGIDEEDEEAKWNRYKMQVDSGIVQVAEIRKKEDMPDVLDEDGQVAKWTQAPGNATLIQAYMADMQAKQAKEQQAQQGIQSAQQNAQEQMKSDDAHQKQLEIMDKQHKQAMEAQGMQQKHQTNLETMKQKAVNKAPDIKANRPNTKLKKSLQEEELEIIIDWVDY